jgi:hypothetical protein
LWAALILGFALSAVVQAVVRKSTIVWLLGDEQAMLRLQRRAQPDVWEVDIVTETWVARILDAEALTHRRRPVRELPGG